MIINVIQHDDRLCYLRLFYNGAFSIAPKNDLDDQNLLLATVHIGINLDQRRILGTYHLPEQVAVCLLNPIYRHYHLTKMCKINST
jgi:hypothetical protein